MQLNDLSLLESLRAKRVRDQECIQREEDVLARRTEYERQSERKMRRRTAVAKGEAESEHDNEHGGVR